MEILQYIYDAHLGGMPIGGASAIRLSDGIHLLTAYHVSHDVEHDDRPRSLVFRSRSGRMTLYSPHFTKVRGSRDIALSDLVALPDGLPVAKTLDSSDQYRTIGAAVGLCQLRQHVIQTVEGHSIPIARAPEYLQLRSRQQDITFGFSGKPVLNQYDEVVAVITSGIRPVRGEGKTTGFAEILRARRFR